MRPFIAGLTVSALFLPVFSITLSRASVSRSYDIILQGGKIVDGTGGPWYYGDVGIRRSRIAKIGLLKAAKADKRIDATGLVIAPGFIDLHTHTDEEIERLPLAYNYLRQGVTTLVGGNCGESVYPVGESLVRLKRSGLGINFALLVGQATIRRQVMGMADRTPTQNEMKRIKALLAEAMQQGAIGMSTGLFYAPGSYSRTEEVVELARVAVRYGGIYASHIRDESDYHVGLTAAVKEAIEIGEKSKIPVQISHLKALGRPVWGKSAEVLDLIRAARDRGVDVTFDQYPYDASSTSLTGAVVPRWAQAGGEVRMKERLLDPATREKIRAEMLLSIEKRGGPENLFLVIVAHDPGLEGKHLAEIGRIKEKEPVDAAIDILLAGDVGVVSFSMQEEDVVRIMRSPDGMVASDGSLVQFGKGAVHPRYYGTFPRVLGKYVREDGILTLEDAVRKMTSAPANRIGLKDRGLIREGMIADITVFNPATVKDRATFQKPHQYPEGIEHVIVNGQPAVSGQRLTGIRAGKVLSRPKL